MTTERPRPDAPQGDRQPIWEAESDAKRAAVRRMFDEIAPRYDLLNRVMTLRQDGRWRRIAVDLLRLQPGDQALDVCCGTGDVLTELRRRVGANGRAVGVDFSAPMLGGARAKGYAELAQGDACRLPFGPNLFHGVSVAWGMRNVPDVDAAHAEAFRVLRPGGRFVSLDMARPQNPLLRAVSEFVFNTVVPRIGALFGRQEAYTYLPKSVQRFSTREQLASSMRRAGFTDVGTRDLLFGNLCVHHGTKPESTAS